MPHNYYESGTSAYASYQYTGSTTYASAYGDIPIVAPPAPIVAPVAPPVIKVGSRVKYICRDPAWAYGLIARVVDMDSTYSTYDTGRVEVRFEVAGVQIQQGHVKRRDIKLLELTGINKLGNFPHKITAWEGNDIY